MTFNELGLLKPIIMGLEEAGHVVPTPIQELAIPHILNGEDVLGCAETGTGKTAAFVLPILQHITKLERKDGIFRATKVLILTPTRELAIQIRDNIKLYSANINLRSAVILGGVNQKSQNEVLKKGIDIIVATPGRLLDLINQKKVKLNEVEILVLDEADTMLDMGFIHDVKKILIHVPKERQTLFFSATMSKRVNDFADSLIKNYVSVKTSEKKETVDNIMQEVYYVDKTNKINLLKDILKNENVKSALIFTRTKHGANKLERALNTAGIVSNAIHGNKSQNARVKALTDFKKGICRVLVATDVAARGIDIKELSHVINYDIPVQPEVYIHRIGRTGRAGQSGIAISFCSSEEKNYLKSIEKTINKSISINKDSKYSINLNKDHKENTPNLNSNQFKKKKYYKKLR